MNEIKEEKLEKYFKLASDALEKAKKSKESVNLEAIKKAREDFVDIVERYIEDAKHFRGKGDEVNAFAALNYAHGFLDAGARLGIFDVHDNKLFAQD
ncbi:MAG: hypothetical protein CMH63_01955 [Nanoarchaeota archaeon]|jgi:hypothetical protein|nr:hypothetical protein [Nanoarchaeota archaeon]|tara:strand:+ start:19937 stop:20227 length:291 start_codon:yes stop_codon:yes gene_type:complete